MSFDLILPYLRPIEHLLTDPNVTEIMVNASGRVFVERMGLLEGLPVEVTIPERQRQAAVRNIARVLDNDISEEKPLLDSRLPDGSRVAAVLSPTSIGGTILNIRKFRERVFTLGELLDIGSLTERQHDCLRQAVETHQTILISGGTGAGKTVLLNALTAFLPQDERVVVIEDTSELRIELLNLVRLEARLAQPDLPAITIRDLLRQTLRLRPDRIILGEVRGAEAFDLLQALNTGHTGSISTIHANSADLAISRLVTCIAMAGVEQSERAVSRNIAEVVNIIVQLERRAGKRRVVQVLEVNRYHADTDRYDYTELAGEANDRL